MSGSERHTIRLTTGPDVDHDLAERHFDLDGVPGILWTPTSAAPSSPAALIVLGQPGGIGMQRMRPRLVERARSAAALGFATITLELPGSGDRAPLPGADRARAELRRALDAGLRPSSEVVDRLILPLVDVAVPEWQTAIDAALEVPGVGGGVAVSGGVIAVGTRLAAVDPRVVAAGLFAGSYVPRATLQDARRVTIPVHLLLQWDDEGNDRQAALELFDAFGSSEKTLQANMGGHTGVPPFAGEDAARFFERHLGPSR